MATPAITSGTEGDRAVIFWLKLILAWILLMVTVGGVTRLTGSGLSIVNWAPIMGAIPPLSDQQWQEAFAGYQSIPQYRLINPDMTMGEFKFIFFWEYSHRLLGRLLGVVFLIPWLYFVVKGKISKALGAKLLFGFVLGGLQGVLGWFMVMSGLADRPYVSHYRLAAHLSLALLVLSYLYWILLSIEEKERAPASAVTRRFHLASIGITILLWLQITYGAFVAGLKAGYAYNTFPLMLGQILPGEALAMEPLARNLVESPAMVQFIHRSLGWLLLASVTFFWWKARSAGQLLGNGVIRASKHLAGAVVIQFFLGVLTLLLSVPVFLGVLHQLWACFVLLAALRLNNRLIHS